MKAIKYILLLSLSLCKAIGQNVMTSSPYSMFGIGEISYGLNGGNAGMGGVSLGFREKNWLNMSNPAGLSAIDSCRMYAEVSAFAKLENYRSGGSFNQTFTGNFSGFALAGRMVPHWYAGIELKPYSSVGYYFQTEQEVEGAPGSYYTSLFTGNGGWSKFQLTNSFLLHGLSLGVNIGFLFGKSKNNETQSEISVSEELSGQAWSFDFGLQYTLQLQKELWLTFGALYSLTTDMEMDRTQSLSDSELKSNDFTQSMPRSFGGGVSVRYKKLTYAFDYLHTQYGRLKPSDSRITYADTHEWRAGMNFSPKGFSSSSIWKRMDYKLGVSYTSPYNLKIQGHTGSSWRVTAGFGFPLLNGRLHTAIFYDRASFGIKVLEQSTAGLVVSYSINELFHHTKL